MSRTKFGPGEYLDASSLALTREYAENCRRAGTKAILAPERLLAILDELERLQESQAVRK